MTQVDSDAMRRYEAARDGVATHLEALRTLLPLPQQQNIERAHERLARDRFVLAVVGEFSSGKSFLLNALLGKFGLLATDINPSTAAITEIGYGIDESAYALYEDGRRERIPMDRLSRFIAVGKSDEGKLHDATDDESRAPTRVLVSVDSPFLQRGFSVADTPGLASINPAHRRATLQFLPSADAVLYLIDTQQPFTEGDAAFLGIIRQHLDTIFIVQTKIDLWTAPQADGKPVWQGAYERIAALAAVHAPGTYVYALSARDYVEGTTAADPLRIEASRFDAFLSALDASLIATTGRARLQRAASAAHSAVDDAVAALRRDSEMLALAPEELRARIDAARPAVEALSTRAAAQHAAIRAAATQRRAIVDSQSKLLVEDAQAMLAQAFDTADVARLRDRARLHMLVDRVFAKVIGEFANDAGSGLLRALDEEIAQTQSWLPFRFALSDAAAQAFGAQAGSGLWTGDLRAAISASIVLSAIGGPAISLVTDIARRFAAAPPGQYMKRELTADLRSVIFPHLAQSLDAFAGDVCERFQAIFDALEGAIDASLEARRNAELGSIERALATHSRGAAVAGERAAIEATISHLQERDGHIAATVAQFMEREVEITPADAGPEVVRRAHSDVTFDQDAYSHGLRPTRWRIAVLGALRRGKSSLINAIAGTRVLADEAAGEIAFPVHVRYGPAERAYALQPDGQWQEVEVDTAMHEATRNPVLIETPWRLPRELVLVHVPAFDTGDATAESIAVVAASRASEVLCLFSRQLSDRELDIFERVADLNKPMLFAHTLADHENTAERRQVVELAASYLGQRAIPVKRLFTISTLDYAQARRENRAPSGWNELDALIATLSADAEAHMQRLARLERAASVAQATSTPAAPEQSSPVSRAFARLFKKQAG